MVGVMNSAKVAERIHLRATTIIRVFIIQGQLEKLGTGNGTGWEWERHNPQRTVVAWII